MQIMKASNQWATRPAEERFWDLQELHAHCKTVHGNAAEATAVLGDLRVEADNSDLKLVGKQGVPATISHFAFGQLAARVKAPAGYLRGLPPTLAAQISLRRGRMIASGPGQKASASFCARTSQPITVRFAIAASRTCAMSGFDEGRCLRR